MLMLLFHIGNERYICDCKYVMEVLPQVELKPLPHAPEFVIGLLNYGGQPIPVVDLSLLIEKRNSKPSMHTRIMMMKCEDESGKRLTLGVLAEKVTETRMVDSEKIIDAGMQVRETKYIDGVLNDEEGMIRYLVVDKLFEFLQEEVFK